MHSTGAFNRSIQPEHSTGAFNRSIQRIECSGPAARHQPADLPRLLAVAVAGRASSPHTCGSARRQ
jgi:hypothetical protein